ncbi:MAG: winged helix-turn-helix transcriptional regulator [Thermoplasmatota archaeon]
MTADCNTVLKQLPDVPESTRKVVCELASHQPLTGLELREATGLPRRTAYAAIKRLKELGVLKERLSFRDSRQTYYWLDEATIAPQAAAPGPAPQIVAA